MLWGWIVVWPLDLEEPWLMVGVGLIVGGLDRMDLGFGVGGYGWFDFGMVWMVGSGFWKMEVVVVMGLIADGTCGCVDLMILWLRSRV